MRARLSALRTLLRRTGLVLVSVALLGIGASGAVAETRSELADARKRLAGLEARVTEGQGKVSALHRRLTTLAAEIEEAGRTYTEVLVEVVKGRQDLEAARARWEELQGLLTARVREVYMRGVDSSLQMVLLAGSLTDVTYGLEYQDRLVERDASLAREARAAAAAHGSQRKRMQELLDRQTALLAHLDLRQRELTETVTRQQAVLEELSLLRLEMVGLVKKLTARLRAAELAAPRAVIAEAPVGYREWAALLLEKLGAPRCRDNQIALVAWQTAEGTSARWNPLATTLDMPGAGVFNSHRVRNYVSREQGLEASVLTLERGATSYGYGAILEALRACADAMVTARAVNQSKWCAGCAGGRYVLALVPAVQASFERPA